MSSPPTAGLARRERGWLTTCLVAGVLVTIAIASALGIPQGQWQHLLPTAAIGAAAGALIWLLVRGAWRVLVGLFAGIVVGFFAGWGAMAVWANLIRQPDPYDTLGTVVGDLIVFGSVWILGSLAGLGIGSVLEIRHRRVSRRSTTTGSGA